MLRFRSLGSGSSGNATVIEARCGLQTTRLLVDCGFSLRALDARLAAAGLAAADLSAVFITHAHSDHVGCVRALSQREGLPVYLSEGTWRACAGLDLQDRLRVATDGEALELGALHLTPFAVPHDAPEPLQLRASDGDRHLGVLTDLGHVPVDVLGRLAGVHALLLECNHDPERLAASSYPPYLKRRVGGAHGHLANAQAAEAAAALAHAALGTVMAAHLSARNNTPELARQALSAALGRTPEDIPVADPRHGSAWWTV